MAIENNLPPQWEKSPIAVCRANKIFFDTLLAKDPEGSPITYSLIKGPPGMDLEPKTGILRFLPKKAAVYSIQISAADSGNLCANMNYELTVTALSRKSTPGKLCAVINAPGIAAPNEPVVIDASRSASTNAPLQTLSFRFDIDGNCKWESPESGGFGVDAAVTHTFKSEGAYIVQVLVKNSAGKTASAKCSIVIHAKPVAKIVVSPPQLTVHQECTLDASQSLVGKIGAPFEVRWDLDNNGIWDFPKNGSYTAMKSVKNAWTAPGIYSVILEIKDRLGAQAWASAEIEVKPETIIPVKPKPDGIVPKTMVPVKCTTTFEAPHASAVVSSPATISAGGIYQTHVYSPLTFAGTALYPNGKIIRYAWDFYGKGSFDTASETSGKVTHVYRLSGTYRPVLKVTTNDNKTLYDTAFVTVINTPPVANAGKDVFSKKGKKVHLKGTGEDLDDGIGLYEWDFTNDGIYEWSSPMSAETEHAFNEYSYAVLRVTDRNGATGKDTLRVVICPAGMVSVEQGMFCIDEYEWSNNKGAVPEREMTYDDAVKKCVESGKHLCSGQEWESACAGMHNRQYPKSKAPPTQNCNVIGNRAYPNKIAPSGSFSDCRSPSGAYDMNGNVAEWTESEKPDSAFVYGGSWHNDLGNAQCSSKLLLKKSSGYFYVGFRCCK
jgi:PKD repeat protein